MLPPLPYGVAAADPADVKDQLPQRLHSGVCIQLREHLGSPGLCRQGGNGPLDPIVHGVLPPGLHKAAVGVVHPADLCPVQPGKQLRVVGDEVQHADAALALGVIQIPAQLPALVVGQCLLAAQLHPDTGGLVVGPVYLHIPCPCLVGAADAQPCQRRTIQRAVDDQHLPGLGVHPHPDDKVSVFLQQFVEVFHGKASCGVNFV